MNTDVGRARGRTRKGLDSLGRDFSGNEEGERVKKVKGNSWAS